jgi:hypothetical protein
MPLREQKLSIAKLSRGKEGGRNYVKPREAHSYLVTTRGHWRPIRNVRHNVVRLRIKLSILTAIQKCQDRLECGV